jgi:hypothetical protein
LQQVVGYSTEITNLTRGKEGIDKENKKVEVLNEINQLCPEVSLSFLQFDKELSHTF